jgi:hypothetical protein
LSIGIFVLRHFTAAVSLREEEEERRELKDIIEIQSRTEV